MTEQLITVGTDGATNWVATPDGRKYNLGLLSVVKLVTSLVTQKKRAVQLMSKFVDEGAVMFKADPVTLGRLLGRVASSPSMDQGSLRNMTLLKDLNAIEKHIAALKEAAEKKASNLQQGVEVLVKMASTLSCDETIEAIEEEALQGVAHYSYDSYVANTKAADEITMKASTVVERIETLVGEGKKFNASKAKVDVRNVTVRVASLLREDISKPGMAEELGKLSSEMNRLHSLFFPVRG